MKKFFSVLLVVLLSFGLFSCANEGTETETEYDEENAIPILGVEIRNENEASFYALTRSTTYIWETGCDEDGNIIYETIHDGIFCLDMDDICTFTREQTGRSISLKFSGDLKEYKIYAAKTTDFGDKEKSEIINEKYLVGTNKNKIDFPENGEYYYVVDVEYLQGQISYGFILADN